MTAARKGLATAVILATLYTCVTGAVPATTLHAMPSDGASSQEPNAALAGVGEFVVGEGHDWFTLEFGAPRDYSSPNEVTWVEHLTTAPVVAGGTFRGSFGPWGRLSVLYPGMGPGAIDEPSNGAHHPVDADHYRRVVFRAHVAEPARHFWWAFREGFDKHATLVGDGWMHAGWGTYVVELNDAWNGRQQGLSLVLPEGANDLRLDWVRLLPSLDHARLSVAWEGNGRGTVDLIVDDNRDPSDGYVYEAASGIYDGGSAMWSPDVLPPGRYYTYVRHSEPGQPLGACTPDAIRVEPLPVLRFMNPTMDNGLDYATHELGNPWDMDSVADVFEGGTWRWSWQGLKRDPTFHDGVLRARNDGPDPYFYLNVDPDKPIDTSRYRYLSWRWRVDAGSRHSPTRLDVVHGLMSRFMYYAEWPYRGNSMNTGNDIVIWDGWRTYTIDLFKPHVDDGTPGSGPGWTGQKRGLRFDPLEGRKTFDFEVDWIRLTTEPELRAGAPFPIRWSLRDGTVPADVHLHFDADRSWGNGMSGDIGKAYDGGRTPIEDPELDHTLYLPYAGLERQWYAHEWHVPDGLQGRYWIVAEVTNRFGRSYWYSDVPIVVEP